MENLNEEKGLAGNEFAIREGAKFILMEGSTLQITEEGDAIITYRLKSKVADLVKGPKKPEEMPSDFDSYAVFLNDKLEKFVNGLDELTLVSTVNKDVVISSKDDSIFVFTNGEKRESGIGAI